MKRSTNRNASILAIAFLLACWWWESWDFNDPFVAGEYISETAGACNVLTLNMDHSFDQQLWQGDRSATHSTGSWRRFGEAGIAFSTTFLGAAPDSIAKDNVYGMLDNTFGYHTLTIDSQTKPVRFHKSLIHLRTCA